MRKFIISFVLAQFLLLVNGYNHLQAHVSQDCNYSSIVLKDSSFETNLADVKNVRSFVFSSERPLKLEVAEIEEEKYKFLSPKRYLTGFNFFTILFPDQTPGHFFGYMEEGESFVKPLKELASNSRYAKFGVFRI